MTETLPDTEKFKWKHLPQILWKSAVKWNDDDVFQLSASVAYYAILALPGLMVIMISIIGQVWDTEIATGKLTTELSGLVGYGNAQEINKVLQTAQSDSDSWVVRIIGIGTLIFGATGVFYQMQLALNKIWKLKINPKTPWWKILTDRAKSFGFILILGFLILTSFLLSAVIGLLQTWIENNLSEYIGVLAIALNYLIALAIISFLFGLMFRYLPDANVKWKTVWPGAILTGLLFQTGKFLLEIYFVQSSPGSAYGAAGMIVLLLLWVSYSCLIIFYGAEFIKIYANRYVNGIQPSSKALLFKEEIVVVKKGDEIPDSEAKENEKLEI